MLVNVPTYLSVRSAGRLIHFTFSKNESTVYLYSMATDSGGGLTCITCRVMFARGELQRDHYKTDWHRYNLKRKVAELPSVTAEQFQKKVLAQQEKGEVDSDGSISRPKCNACNKSFQSIETYENHCLSKKHKEIVKKVDDKPASKSAKVIGDDHVSDSEEWEDDENDDSLGLEECLFCVKIGETLDHNLQHMSSQHGFFIPDLEFCTDLEGLLTYLGKKVAIGYMCLWCSEHGRRFHSLEAVQKHMNDKGHCKMWHEGEAVLEYEDFFDYSSSYPDDGTADVDSEAPSEMLEEKDWQLMLPSGATVGHRSLMRYYRQKLKPEQALKRKKGKGGKQIDKLMSQYRAIGWTGTTGAMAVRKAQDIKFMHKLFAKRRTKLDTASSNRIRFRGRCGQETFY